MSHRRLIWIFTIQKTHYCEFHNLNLNGFDFYMINRILCANALLHRHHFTRQELSHFFSPNNHWRVFFFFVQIKRNTAPSSCERLLIKPARLQFTKTSLECYSMSDTCNLNYNFKTVKKKKKHNNRPSLKCTASFNILNI